MEETNPKIPFEDDHLHALNRMHSLPYYYRWIHDRLQPWICGKVLDTGCGTGNFIHEIASYCDAIYGVDLSRKNLEVAKTRLQDATNVYFVQGDLELTLGIEDAGFPFDTVIALDVLEHIRDDIEIAKKLARLIRPGGCLLLKVPACPFLFGTVDIASSHFRRYTPERLRLLARECNLDVEMIAYMNLAGVVPYFIKSRLIRSRKNFSESFSGPGFMLVKQSLRVARLLDYLLGPPLGQSLVAAQKPNKSKEVIRHANK